MDIPEAELWLGIHKNNSKKIGGNETDSCRLLLYDSLLIEIEPYFFRFFNFYNVFT